MTKQKPPSAYDRRKSLERLREMALTTSLIVSDLGDRFEVRVGADGPAFAGRHEAVAAFIQGWVGAVTFPPLTLDEVESMIGFMTAGEPDGAEPSDNVKTLTKARDRLRALLNGLHG